MIHTIASETYDVLGYIVIDVLPASTFQAIGRRVSRSKTLDGGVAISDGGYAEGDRTIDIRWVNSTATIHAAISRLLLLYSRLVVSARDGVFLVAPEQYRPGPESSLRLLVIEKLSA